MAFGEKQPVVQIGADRLAAIAGGGAAAATAGVAAIGTPRRQFAPEPDISKMRPNVIEETPEERKRRLAAKTVNFSITILARLMIIGAAGYYAWQTQQFTGDIHGGVAMGIFVMVADLGRVGLKALAPGSR